MHATESAVEVRRARRRLREAATDERVGVFTPDKDGDTADGAGGVPVIAARRGAVCGEVGRVPRFCSTQHPHPLLRSYAASHGERKDKCIIHFMDYGGKVSVQRFWQVNTGAF